MFPSQVFQTLPNRRLICSLFSGLILSSVNGSIALLNLPCRITSGSMPSLSSAPFKEHQFRVEALQFDAAFGIDRNGVGNGGQG